MKTSLDRLKPALLEDHFRALFESNIVGVAVTNPAGEIFDANATFLKIAGYDLEDIDSGALNWKSLVPANEIGLSGCQKPIEREYLKKDGDRIPVLEEVKRVVGPEERFVTFVLDLSETRKMKSDLLQATKAASIGQFTFEIVHDINNLLATIMIASEGMLETACKTDAATAKGVGIVLKCTASAAALTRYLLGFSRRQTPCLKLINIGSAATNMTEMLKRLLGSGCDLRIDVAKDTMETMMDKNQIEQIIMNLSVNARDAMPKGGAVTITTENVDIHEAIRGVKNGTLPIGQYVRLSVKDTGCGMDSNLIDQIFDSYFTTKSKGNGTGLGLSTVLRIVQDAGGAITVDSTIGKGSEFNIYLPIHVNTAHLIAN